MALREVTISIDEKTGDMEIHIEGVKGPACETILKDIERIAGKASRVSNTPDYYKQDDVRVTARR